MKINVDRVKCTGLGICESFAPDVFEVDEDGHLRLLHEQATPELQESVQAAIDSCPTEALSLEAN